MAITLSTTWPAAGTSRTARSRPNCSVQPAAASSSVLSREPSSFPRSTPRGCWPISHLRRATCWTIWAGWSTSAARGSRDPQLRQRNDEGAAAAAVFVLLRENFFAEVPRQQQHVVGHFGEQILRRSNGQPRTCQPAAVFLWIAVDDELEHVDADPQRVEQHRAFGAGAIGGQAPPAALSIPQHVPERLQPGLDASAECRKPIERACVPCRFVVDQVVNGADRARIDTGEDANRSP